MWMSANCINKKNASKSTQMIILRKESKNGRPTADRGTDTHLAI